MQAKEQAAKALQMASDSGKGKVPESSPQLEIGECSRAPQLRTTPRMRTFTIPSPSQQHEDLPGVPLLSPSLRQAVDRVVSRNTSLHMAFSDHNSTKEEEPMEEVQIQDEEEEEPMEVVEIHDDDDDDDDEEEEDDPEIEIVDDDNNSGQDSPQNEDANSKITSGMPPTLPGEDADQNMESQEDSGSEA